MDILDPGEYRKLALCFSPGSAAIIGASTDPMKFGGRALKFCLERGFGGRMYPVNARNEVVQGVRAHASVADLPEAPDIAVIAVPAAQVRENLIAAGEKGAKVAIVYGAQFAEAGGEGQARQADLLDIARAHGMRMIGPNCMGVISLASGFVASFTAAPEHHDGNGWPDVGSVSVASQSGAVGIQMFAQLRDRGLGLANWISTGNQADIDVADAIAYYAEDAATRTIAVYMEDAGRGLKLIQALELARRAKKPVVILKVGTTPLGGRAAAGHTASMYVEDRVVGDLFDQYGVLRARSVNELIDLVAACNTGVMPKGNRVAAVSVSGGGAVMIADAASQAGLELIDYDAEALAELKETNAFVNDRNPIDISAPSMSNMAITGGHIRWGTERGAPISVGYISHVPLVPRTRSAIMPQLLGLTGGKPDQLIALAANLHPEDRKALVQTGLAVFDDPTVMTEAVGKLAAAAARLGEPAQVPSPGPETRRAVQDIGIPFAPEMPVATVAEALAVRDAHGTIVLKISGEGLHHRTEIGGVVANLRHDAAIAEAFEALSAHTGYSVIAQPHLTGVEMLAAVRDDPHFGPLVLLGTGGTMCEVFDDVVYRKAPITTAQAEDMIGATRGARMLGPWRGRGAVDRAALARALVALGQAAPGLGTLEINPLIVMERGVMAVDLVVSP